MKRASVGPVILAAQVALIALVLAWDLDLPAKLGIQLYTEQFLSAVLGLALFLAFVLYSPVSRTGDTPRGYDLAAGVLALGCCWYISIRYPALVDQLVYRPWDGVLVGAAIIVLTLEATRRAVGKALVIVMAVLVLYALLGHLLSGVFQTREVALSRLAVYLALDTNSLLGLPVKVAIVVVVPFILLGRVLAKCGGDAYFADLAMSLMGRYRGGGAKIAVVGSALFGMVSGSAVANVAGVGTLTIPLMVRSGFPPRVAAAVEAVGSTGGQLMPPIMGASAFLMAAFLEVPYSVVLIAAIIPALLYYFALFVQVDLEAAKKSIRGARLEEVPSLGAVLKAGWHFPIPFVLLVIGLVHWNWEAQYAALVASGVLVVLGVAFGYKGERFTLGDAAEALASAGKAAVEIIVITAAAGLVIGVLNITGLAFGLALQLLTLSGGHLIVLLLITAALSIVLGMGMPTTGVYVILATLAAPALVKYGISDLQANLFVLYFGMMSMVTPPVALAAFTAATIAGAGFWQTGWSSVRVGWCAYVVPFMFALSPALIGRGSPGTVAMSLLTALLGIFFGSGAAVGYLGGPLGVPQRLVAAVLALTLLLPTNAFSWAAAVNAAAAAIALAWAGWMYFTAPAARSRRAAG